MNSMSAMKNVLKHVIWPTQHVFNVFLVLDREFIHGPIIWRVVKEGEGGLCKRGGM